MTNCEEAIKVGQLNEGGWNTTSGDRGGETYEGVARNFWPDWRGWAKIDAWKSENGEPRYNEIFSNSDIPGIQEDVIQFYTDNFCAKMHANEILSQKVAVYLYDWFINSGAVAIRHLQAVLGIKADGDFGPSTLQATNDAGEGLLEALHNSRDAFYASHVAAVPADAKFLAGWDKRSDNLYNKLKAE